MDNLTAAVTRAERVLVAAGLSPDEARRDATILARSVLGWDQARWLANRRDSPPADFLTHFSALVERRRLREPVSQILGEREFYGRVFRVTRDVLTPRPETEFVVEECLASRGTSGATVVDVGTGSGCLAITIALERRDARLVATDVSEAALTVARHNARHYGVTDGIDFRLGAFLAGFDGTADIIVSNPPYIPDGDRGTLMPEVSVFEPSSALFAGVDGLDVIRPLLSISANALRIGGSLVMEIGAGQADAVRQLATAAGFSSIRFRSDLQGIARVFVAARL